jgi:phage baseplate assembly protein W
MSFDFNIAHACPHLTIEEEVVLGGDRRSLVTRQPVASSSRVRITVNDQLSVPRGGLLSRAQLSGSVSGPFRIIKNENTVTIRNRSQSIQDFELPVGARITTDRVAELLNNAFRSGQVNIIAQNMDGYLRFTDLSDQGTRSQIRISGPATAQLGFVSQVRARGRTVYPAWDFGERQTITSTPGLTSIRQVPARFPVFERPIKGNPIFKVSYTTYQRYCRRCQGFGIENDYLIAADGSPFTIVNENLLNQDVLKVLSTIKGSNPFHPEYGTTLLTRIGTKATGAGVASVNEDVVNSLSVFQRLQEAAGRYQEITARQRLATLIAVNTTPSEFDPTVFEVQVIAANASNVPVVVSTVFAAPGTAALAGSNGLSLGLEGFGLDRRTGTIPGIAPPGGIL